MKKRLVAMMLVASMTVLAIAGCGNSKKESENGSNGKETGNSGELTNIVMQLPVIGDTPTGLADVEKAINEITEDEIGVTVTLLPANAFNLATETSLAISSSEQLDLTVSLFSGISSMVSQGIMIPLDDLLASNGQDIVEKCDIQLAGGMYGGQQYAVPIAYMNGVSQAFIADKAVLDEAGVEIDSDKYYTTDELETIFDKVKAKKGSNYYMFAGGYSETDQPFGSLYMVDTFDAGLGLIFDEEFNTDNVVTSIYESDAYAECADLMYAWAQKGFFSPDASTTTEVAASQMAAGTALGVLANNTPTVTAEYQLQTGKECVAIKTREAFMNTSLYQSVLWGITSSSENPEKAMDLLNLLYTNADVCNLLMYGIEGVSYEVTEQDSNGTIISQLPDAPYSMPFGIFGDRLSWHVTAPATTKTNIETKEISDAVELSSPALGFVPDYSEVSTEYSSITAVITQYRAILNTGAIDPAQELPEFINALKNAGIATVLEEVQSQYDEWQAKQ